ncbi:MAG: hypothetical protein ACREPB_04395 [Arenimonas sp.]
MSHRKIPALRGLYWCLEAWRNLRASPQPIFSMAMWLSLGMLLPGPNVFMAILITVFYGGMISSLHKKYQGEQTGLGNFFDGFKSLSRFLSLFTAGLPTVLFAIFSGTVLINAIGADTLQSLSQATQPPSKEMAEAIFPILFEVILKLLPIGIVAGWLVFLAVPRSMLDKRLGLLALFDAVRAIFTNLGALILFSGCILAAIVFISFVLAIPLALIAGAGGALASILQTFVLVFISTLGWALYLNAMYIAWRDIFMPDATAPVYEAKDLPETQIEV